MRSQTLNISLHVANTRGIYSAHISAALRALLSLLVCRSARGCPTSADWPSVDHVNPGSIILTCVGRTQVGQGDDLVASSDTLHHVVAAVFAPTGTHGMGERHRGVKLRSKQLYIIRGVQLVLW